MYLISFISTRSEPRTVTHEAINPDLHLISSKVYAEEHAYNRSIMHLDKAIEAILDIEQEIDEDGKSTVEKAIRRLEIVRNEILHDSLSMQDMNRAFIDILNALTYAEIKVTERYIKSKDVKRAKVALKYATLHIKNAIKFSRGQARIYEMHLYSELDSIIENNDLSDEQIIARLDHMLTEIDTAITSD